MRISLSLFPIACLSFAILFVPSYEAIGQNPIQITSNTNVLAGNTANQAVALSLSGTAQTRAVNVFAEFDQLAGVNPGITSADILTGTVFGSVANTGAFDLGTSPNRGLGVSVSTQSGTVATDGLLVTFLVDTTGISDGDFTLNLNPVALGDTEFINASGVDVIPFDFSNNVFTVSTSVVPEPSSFCLLSGIFGLMAVRRRRV